MKGFYDIKDTETNPASTQFRIFFVEKPDTLFPFLTSKEFFDLKVYNFN